MSEYSSIMSSLDADGITTPSTTEVTGFNWSNVKSIRGTFKVLHPFTIDTKALYPNAPVKAGQKTSFVTGDVVRVTGSATERSGRGGKSVYYFVPIKFADGKVLTAKVNDYKFQKVSLTCGADGKILNFIDEATGIDLGNDQGECINPNTPVIDNDPNGEAKIPQAKILGMPPIIAYSVFGLVLATGLFFGIRKLIK